MKSIYTDLFLRVYSFELHRFLEEKFCSEIYFDDWQYMNVPDLISLRGGGSHKRLFTSERTVLVEHMNTIFDRLRKNQTLKIKQRLKISRRSSNILIS